MLQTFKNGQGSIVLRVKLLDSSVATGAGLTGLTSASAGLIISTIADNEATATTYTQAGSTIETITTLGTYAAPTATKCRFKEVDATNHKGIYEIQIADARFAVSSAKSLLVSLSGATNLAQADFVIQLQSLDPFDAVRAGLTAFPNVASGSAGALLVDGTGTAAISNSSGKVLLQATQSGVTIPTVTTVTNQLTAAAIATGVWTDTTAGDFTTALSVGKSVMNGVSLGTGLTVASVSGAVGSVTGAVGSVTGAVGSVTGSVGSVTGAVGSVTGNVGGNVVGSVASVTARVTANADQINADATSAANLAKTTRAIGRGTVDVGASTTSIPTSAFAPSGAAADQFKGRIITFDANTSTAALQGQATDITASSNAANPTLTVTALTTAPSAGDLFSVT